MNIVLFGNGKMGKLIDKLATEKGHNIVTVSSSNNPANNMNLSTVDVAIDNATNGQSGVVGFDEENNNNDCKSTNFHF